MNLVLLSLESQNSITLRSFCNKDSVINPYLETHFIFFKPLTHRRTQSREGHGPKTLFTQTGASSFTHRMKKEPHIITIHLVSNNGSIHKAAKGETSLLLEQSFCYQDSHVSLPGTTDPHYSVYALCIPASSANDQYKLNSSFY